MEATWINGIIKCGEIPTMKSLKSGSEGNGVSSGDNSLGLFSSVGPETC